MNPRCGTRSRYAAGCRCALCRQANAEYQHGRKRADRPREVSAEPVRRHILTLRSQGVGSRSIADACGLDRSTVTKIADGQKDRIFRSTAAKILDVDQNSRADSSLLPADPTRRHIDRLTDGGYTKRQIAVWLGYSRMLQFSHDRITAANALRVERLVTLLDAGKIARGGPGLGRSNRGVSADVAGSGNAAGLSREARA